MTPQPSVWEMVVRQMRLILFSKSLDTAKQEKGNTILQLKSESSFEENWKKDMERFEDYASL